MKNMFTFIQEKCLQHETSSIFKTEEGTSVSYKKFNIELLKCLQKIEPFIFHKSGFNFSIIAPNSINYLLFLFSMSKLKGSAVNLNPNLLNNEIKERLLLGEVQYLICTTSIYNRLKEILEETNVIKIFIINSNTIQFQLDKVIEINSFKTKTAIHNSDIAFLQFTGGTSGIMKAAIISHQNILENIEQLDLHFKKYTSLSAFKVLVAFPFYHVFSIVFNLLFFIKNGGTCFIYKDLRDTELIIKILKENPINLTVGVNTWYNKLMQHDAFKTLNLNKVEISLAGGEYVPLSTKQKWTALTGKPLYSAYGLTETCSLSIISPFDNTNIDDSIGIPVPGTEVILLDEKNNVIHENHAVGEIALKGPQLTIAYYKNDVETQLAFVDKWFKTGDIGKRINESTYKIVDRKKDMISVSGNKVYPNEVESVIFKLDEVLDVGVVAQSSNKSGQTVCACVVIESNSKITEKKIIEFCAQHLSSYKVPKNIYFYGELPKTAIGKTARRILKEEMNNETY